MNARDVDRFWTKVDKSGPQSPTATGNCWLWSTATFTNGYGVFYLDGRTRRAHRVAWEIANGQIPDGMHVLHRCDTPRCVRPDHLFLGTSKDNTQDMIAKARQAVGDRSGARKYPERLLRGAAASEKMRLWAAEHPDRIPKGASHWRRAGRPHGTEAEAMRRKKLAWYHANRNRILAKRRKRTELTKGAP